MWSKRGEWRGRGGGRGRLAAVGRGKKGAGKLVWLWFCPSFISVSMIYKKEEKKKTDKESSGSKGQRFPWLTVPGSSPSL